MQIPSKQFATWLKEVRPLLDRHDDQIPSPANPAHTVLAVYGRPGQAELRGIAVAADNQLEELTVEVAPGAEVLLSDVRITNGG